MQFHRSVTPAAQFFAFRRPVLPPSLSLPVPASPFLSGAPSCPLLATGRHSPRSAAPLHYRCTTRPLHCNTDRIDCNSSSCVGAVWRAGCQVASGQDKNVINEGNCFSGLSSPLSHFLICNLRHKGYYFVIISSLSVVISTAPNIRTHKKQR